MSRGRKILIALGLVFATVAGGLLLFYTVQDRTRAELDAAVRPMIEDLAAAQWSREAFDRHAADELKKWFVDKNQTAGMPSLSVLGSMKDYKGVEQYQINGEAALVVALALFDTGETYFDLRLVKRDGRWQMLAITVDSPSLADKEPAAR